MLFLDLRGIRSSHSATRLAALSKLTHSDNPKVVAAIREQLGNLTGEFLQLLNSPEDSSRSAAASVLSQIGTQKADGVLFAAMKSRNAAVRSVAIRHINPRSPENITRLSDRLGRLAETSLEVRRLAVEVLAESDNPLAVPGLTKALLDQERETRILALKALDRMDPKWTQSEWGLESREQARRNLASEDPRERAIAKGFLSKVRFEPEPASPASDRREGSLISGFLETHFKHPKPKTVALADKMAFLGDYSWLVAEAGSYKCVTKSVGIGDPFDSYSYVLHLYAVDGLCELKFPVSTNLLHLVAQMPDLHNVVISESAMGKACKTVSLEPYRKRASVELGKRGSVDYDPALFLKPSSWLLCP